MALIARAVLQAAATIAKTTETIMGAEVECGGHSFLTVYFSYTKGDETGVYIVPYFMSESEGTAYKHVFWSETAGVWSAEQAKWTLTATFVGEFTLDIRGKEYVKFMQGGSNNDGTPTGTIAASYSMTK